MDVWKRAGRQMDKAIQLSYVVDTRTSDDDDDDRRQFPFNDRLHRRPYILLKLISRISRAMGEGRRENLFPSLFLLHS